MQGFRLPRHLIGKAQETSRLLDAHSLDPGGAMRRDDAQDRRPFVVSKPDRSGVTQTGQRDLLLTSYPGGG